jgi:Zn-dependent peptidase ImmA (M78 family)
MDPEHYAIDILRDLDINNIPVDPYSIAKEFDIAIDEIDVESFDGILIKSLSNATILLNRNIKNEGRRKFTVAHELGHYVMPSHKGERYECNTDCFDTFRSNNPVIEKEANRFAAELLLPSSILQKIVHQYKPDFNDIGDLANDCGTSLTATAIKYVSLTYECCALVASAKNNIKWHKRSSSFPTHIENGTPVPHNTLTRSYAIPGVHQTASNQQIPAYLWIDDTRIDRHTYMDEYCLPVPQYGYVLTMLWLYDFDIEDETDKRDYRYEEGNWKWRDPEE